MINLTLKVFNLAILQIFLHLALKFGARVGNKALNAVLSAIAGV